MVFSNLKLLIKQHFFLLILLIVTQSVAVIAALFSYGIYYNNQYEMNENKKATKEFHLYFEGVFETEVVKEAYPEILYGYEDLIDACGVSGQASADIDISKTGIEFYIEDERVTHLVTHLDSVDLIFSFRVENGKYTSKGEWGSEQKRAASIGWITDEAINDGALQFVGIQELYGANGPYYSIGGKTYEMVAYVRKGTEIGLGLDRYYMPLESFPDTVERFSIGVYFNRQLLRSEYEELKGRFVEAFGDYDFEISEFVVIDYEQKATWRSMMFISGLMALLSAAVVCLIYRYLQKRRERNTAIYMFSGCTRFKAVMIYIVEMMVLLLFSTAVGFSIFEYIIEKKLEKIYIWFTVIYAGNITLYMSLFYLLFNAFIVSIMIAFSTRKTPKELLRQAG